jgi:diguanylate cyclase (GGDEF)-like protein
MPLIPPAADVQSLTVPVAAVLLGIGAAVAGLLAHALRKVRSNDWVVALGWGLGGSFAIGTGFWLLQLLAWRQVQPAAAPWFELLPFVLAWGAAVTGVAVALFVSRWMPAGGVAHGTVLLFLLPTLAVVFVAGGAALAPAPRWREIEAAPVAAALAIVAVGLGLALRLLDGPRLPWLRRGAAQRVVGVLLFALALLLAEGVGLRAAPLSGAITGAALMPPDAVDPRLASVVMMFATALLALAVLAALVDSRGGQRAQALAGSLQSANRRLRELAFSDALSGLPNRLHFEERLDVTLAQVGRQPSAMAVLFIDLDGFKAVNETFGHAAGDEVLREVGRRLMAVAREQDVAARAGGDEFLLLVAQPGSPENAAAEAQRALHALMAPYALPGGSEIRRRARSASRCSPSTGRRRA